MWEALREWASPVSNALAASVGLSQTREVGGQIYTKSFLPISSFSSQRLRSPFKKVGALELRVSLPSGQPLPSAGQERR